MQIAKVITVSSVLGASLLGPVLGVGVEPSEVAQTKLLGEHGLGMVTTSGGYDHAELKVRYASDASGGYLGATMKAAQSVFGRQAGNDDGSNVLFGTTSAITTVTIHETCGTIGSLTTSASPTGSHIYPEATTMKTCPSGSCYNGLVSQPTKATYVPGTIELPDTSVNIPATTDAPKSLASTIITKTTVSSTTTNMILNGTSTISDSTPTNYGPTAPPTAFEPATGAASAMKINLLLGGCLMALVL